MDVQVAEGYVVKEEQRFSAFGDDVIDVECDQVLAYRLKMT